MEETKAKVLVVDDDHDVTALVRAVLDAAGYHVIISRTGEDAIVSSLRERPEAILLDIKLPDIDGLAVCTRLQSDARTKDTPVIFMTATDVGIEQTFEAGGTDFIRKPFTPSEILARVGTHVTLHQTLEKLQIMNARLDRRVAQRTEELKTTNLELEKQIERRKLVEEQLARLSTRDGLTQLQNRNAFYRTMGTDVPKEEFTALITAKVERVGETNQVFGFGAGDEELCRVALAMETASEPTEPIARVGGARFSMLLRDGDPASRANAILDTLREIPKPTDSFGIDVNIGVVPLGGKLSSHEVVMLGDHACQKAKDAGGNLVVALTNSSIKLLLETQSIKTATVIRERFSADGFSLLRQGIQAIDGDELFGHEVFIRPPEIHRTTIDRREFLRHISRLRLRSKIDQWVLNRASYVVPSSRCIIEICDPLAFDNDFWGLAESVVAQRAKNGGTLAFQVDEKLFSDRASSLLRFAKRANECGCDIVIDQFTGQAIDFSQLCAIPGCAVKLDEKFLRNVHSSETMKLVAAVSDVAHAAGFESIAPNISDKSWLEPLKSAGIRYVQGDAISAAESATHYG